MHLNKAVFLLLLFLSALTSIGQENLSLNTHSIFAAEKETIQDNEIWVYKDDSNKLTIDDIKALEPKDFVRLNEVSSFDKTATYWTYFQIANRSENNIDFILNGGNNSQETYFIFQGETSTIKKAGYHFPIDERDIKRGYQNKINFHIPAAETIQVFVEINSIHSNPIDIRVSLLPKGTWQTLTDRIGLFQGIFSGVLVLIIVLGFFIYGFIKEKVFLFFAIYALCNLIYFFHMHGLLELYLFRNLIDPIPPLWLLPLASASAYFAFSKCFLETHIKLNKWPKLLSWASLFSLGTFLILSAYVLFTGNLYLAEIAMYIVLMSLLTVAVGLVVVAARSKEVIAKYFAFGTVFLLATVLIVTLSELISPSYHLPIVVQGGILVEIIIFSLGISHKLKRDLEDHDITQRSLILQLKKNEELQLSINQELEEIVADRTQQINKQNQALKEARQEAEKATKDKSDFLAVMSHEIRTPLNAIISLSHIMEIDNKDKEMTEYIDALKFSAESLHSLINDILDYNKIEAGKLRLESIDFSLIDLLRNVGDTFKYKTKSKGLDLRIEIGEHLPDRLYGDPSRLTQILNNLISNAVKFTQKGYIHIKATLSGLNDGSATIAFSIEDTGIGIPADKLQAIFEDYEQASQETTRQYGGTGLGLSIVKKLLVMMESDIQVSSKEENGTTFSFEIEFKIDPEFNLIDLQEQDRDKDLRRKKILVVDDNDMNRLVLKRLFQIWNADFEEADNGYDALDKCQETDYDIVLMDIEMKPINGFDTTNQLRKVHPNGRPIVIAMSAHNAAEFELELKQLKFADFVHKPFDPEDLFQKLTLHIESEHE